MPQKRRGAQAFCARKLKKCNSDYRMLKKEYKLNSVIDESAK